MIYYKNLSFSYEGTRFNLDINDDITRLVGLSGTGKTYMARALQNFGRNRKNDHNYTPIVLINNEMIDAVQHLLTTESSLIVVDDFDEIVAECSDKLDYHSLVNLDSNQYIIIGRGYYRFTMFDTMDLCKIVHQNRTVSLSYLDKGFRRCYTN